MNDATSASPHLKPVLRRRGPLGRRRAASCWCTRGASARTSSNCRRTAAPGFAYLAPQAGGNSGTPQLPRALERNEPCLSSALAALAQVRARIAAAGIPDERTAWLGFSQGACLALEFVARHARRYGAVAGLSGGLIGPDGTPRDYSGAGRRRVPRLQRRRPHIPGRRAHRRRAARVAAMTVQLCRTSGTRSRTVCTCGAAGEGVNRSPVEDREQMSSRRLVIGSVTT
jgi:pimeloyl-ACP methyl ester carboxylesterase